MVNVEALAPCPGEGIVPIKPCLFRPVSPHNDSCSLYVRKRAADRVTKCESRPVRKLTRAAAARTNLDGSGGVVLGDGDGAEGGAVRDEPRPAAAEHPERRRLVEQRPAEVRHRVQHDDAHTCVNGVMGENPGDLTPRGGAQGET